MSEKRFQMGESDIQGEMIFIDTETNKIYWQEYFNEIVDLVNEQQDTIQSLQKDIIEMSDNHQSYIEMGSETKSKVNDIIRTQRREIRKLSEENEQLEKGKMEALSLLGEEIDKNEQLEKDKAILKERLRECGMRVDKLLGNCR